MALVVAQEVPASSTMAVPHGPAGVGAARRRMREELLAGGAPDAIVDDAVLILSELLSNACRHARPLGPDDSEEFVRAAWHRDVTGELTISVTDGGGPTRPRASTPSVTARGGRGLAIITSLASDWGVDECGEADGSVASGGPGRRTVAGAHAGARRREGGDRTGTRSGGTTPNGSVQNGVQNGVRNGAAHNGATLNGSAPHAAQGGGFGHGAGAPEEPGVTVWAVLTPGERLGGAYAGLDLAELDEPA
ncbi:ATP-binding protein [Streptomyces armeniacus]|uniref:ATP-binding protein n=1 Tax=Streptomyces armeniacus TaxID=83291 RepID=UPI0026C3CF94